VGEEKREKETKVAFNCLGVEKKIVKSNGLALPGRTSCAFLTRSEILEGKENETVELQKLDFSLFRDGKTNCQFFLVFICSLIVIAAIETDVH
jgi:hypothetical protein